MLAIGIDRQTRSTLLGIVGTAAVILPVFLTGAMAVQISASLALSDADLGLAIGAFFAGSAGGSMVLGRLAERLGPTPAIRLGLATTVASNLTIAWLAQGPRTLEAILIVAGLANALTQPAINLLLVRVIAADRLGFVMALKQSGMPAAALVGGLAVPTIALTVGWRIGYVAAAVVAVTAIALTGTGPAPVAAPARPGIGDGAAATGEARAHSGGERARPDLGWPLLALMAAVGMLGGGSANILVAYLVSGAVDAGVAPGPAGLLLTMGAGLGIASRLFHGWLVDRTGFEVLGRVIVLFLVGATGTLGLAAHSPLAYLLATPVAFAAGWAWPGLFNLMVVRANRSAPAAATGITQTGVYVGSLLSPVVAGFLIEWAGYRAAWLLAASSLLGAALLVVSVRAAMAARSEPAGPQVEPTGSTR